MSKPDGSQSEALLMATRRFTRASFTHNKILSSGELSRAEWHLLWLLQQVPAAEGAKPSELARRQKVTAGNVTQQLRNLEKLGMVARKHDDQDRRAVLISLTPSGKKKLKQLRNEFVDDFDKLIAQLGQRNADQLIRLLLLAAEYLEKPETPAC